MVALNPPQPIEPQASRDFGHIHIDFLAPLSVAFNTDIAGVNPLQMLAVSQFLEINARRALLQQAEAQSIAVARPNMPEGFK